MDPVTLLAAQGFAGCLAFWAIGCAIDWLVWNSDSAE